MPSKLHPARRKALAEAWAPSTNDPIYIWGEKFIPLDRTSAAPGTPWRSATTPWVIKPLTWQDDPYVRDTTTVGPSQCAKTTPALVALYHRAKNIPGPILFITADLKKAKETSLDRILWVIRKCKELRSILSGNRFDEGMYSIRLETCTITVASAGSAMALEGTPYMAIYADEWRKWDKGLLQKLEKRTRNFPGQYKIWKFSTPDYVGSEGHASYLSGSMDEWFFSCMGCGKDIWLSPPKAFRALMRWDTNETTKPGGKWNLAEVSKTLRLECPECSHRHFDLPEVRAHILRGGYKSLNSIALPEKKSNRYNGLLVGKIKWIRIFEEFQEATEFMKRGYLDPLKVWATETMAEFFSEPEHCEIEISERPPSTYQFKDVSDEWADCRFFTVDVQAREFWGVVRDWKYSGDSRLVWAGNLLTWGEVVETAQKYKTWFTEKKVQPGEEKKIVIKRIEQSKLVFLDSGFDATRVYAKCCQFGFTALKGEDREYFVHHWNGKTLRRIYSEPTRGDPGIGTVTQGQRFAPLFLFSKPATEKILENLISGAGAPWGVAGDVPEFYWRQVRSWVEKEVTNKQTGATEKKWVQIYKQDHLRACERMQLVPAAMFAILAPEGITI